MQHRIVLETIPTEKIVLPDGAAEEIALGREGLAKLTNDYPWEKLFQSVEKNGFQAIWHGWPNHGDNGFFNPQPFIVNKKGDKYELPNGQRRATVIKMLGLEEVPAYVYHSDWPVKPKEYYQGYADGYEDYLQRTGKGMFQTFEFPHGVIMDRRRDQSSKIFHSTKWDKSYWCGKDVLDVAFNGGYFVFEAKRLGANRSVGFEVDDWMAHKAVETAGVMELDVELHHMDFWNFPAEKEEFDIVMCNQCIYHFGEGEKAYQSLARTASWTKNDLVMFTFIVNDDEYYEDYRYGYRPTREVVVRDLHNLGFQRVRIYHEIPGGKYTVVASKKPEMYPWNWETEEMIYTDYTESVPAVTDTDFTIKRVFNDNSIEMKQVRRDGTKVSGE